MFIFNKFYRKCIVYAGAKLIVAQRLHGHVIEQPHFSGNTPHAKTIRPIWSEINLNNGVIQLQVVANIRADSSWLSSVKEKAAANFMTEEEMIRADAEFVYWKENQ